jgi:glycosyltransferase involved in cell wall biosynthesis
MQQPDAINLHFALYSFPLMNALPKDVPVTFTFHGPWALESEQEEAGKLSVLIKKWVVEKQVYRRCDRFIVLSKAFGAILHQDYQVPWNKIQIIRGGVDLTRFQPNLSRQEARTQLNGPKIVPFYLLLVASFIAWGLTNYSLYCLKLRPSFLMCG